MSTLPAPIKTATHEVVFEHRRDGVVALLLNAEEPLVVCTEYRDGKLVACETKPAAEVIPGMDRRTHPVALISADPEDASGLWCDLAAGVQRWIGWRTKRDVTAALKRAGLDSAQRSTVYATLKKAPAGRVRASL